MKAPLLTAFASGLLLVAGTTPAWADCRQVMIDGVPHQVCDNRNNLIVVPPVPYVGDAFREGMRGGAEAYRTSPPLYERWEAPPVLPPGGAPMGPVRVVGDPTDVRGCALLGEVRDDDLADLAKKVTKKGGNTALLTATVLKPGLAITGGAKRFVVAQAYQCQE